MPAFWAAVPKATVNKNRKAGSVKVKVRFARECCCVKSPTGKPGPNERHAQGQLRGFVSLSTDLRHRFGTLSIDSFETSGPKTRF
jgi:hypothetical protein